MVFVCQTVHALRYASRAREVATLGAVSEKFLPALGGGRKRVMAKPSARNVRGRAAPRMSQMPTLCEDGEESFLRQFNIANRLHPLLTLFLLF